MFKKRPISKYLWKPVLFAFAGAFLGFGYYYFIGCQSGTCPITSNPYISTAYGTVFGLLLGTGGKPKNSGAPK
jgi:hypothetical protein